MLSRAQHRRAVDEDLGVGVEAGEDQLDALARAAAPRRRRTWCGTPSLPSRSTAGPSRSCRRTGRRSSWFASRSVCTQPGTVAGSQSLAAGAAAFPAWVAWRKTQGPRSSTERRASDARPARARRHGAPTRGRAQAHPDHDTGRQERRANRGAISSSATHGRECQNLPRRSIGQIRSRSRPAWRILFDDYRPRALASACLGHGRLTQRKSATFTRSKSQVQSLQRPQEGGGIAEIPAAFFLGRIRRLEGYPNRVVGSGREYMGGLWQL